MSSRSSVHVPVLLNEVIQQLRVTRSGLYCDATLGGGSYTRALLKQHPSIRVLAIDRDKSAIEKFQASSSEDYGSRFNLRHGKFSVELVKHSKQMQYISLIYSKHFKLSQAKFQGIVFDLGFSSDQLNDGKRGFSYMRDGPLDMRYSLNEQEKDLKAVINGYPAASLLDILTRYGQESRSVQIVESLLKHRPINTTMELKNSVLTAINNKLSEHERMRTVSRVFQAFRIFINDELEELKDGLIAAANLLAPSKGRLVVVGFHSLEDGLVQRLFKGKLIPNQSVKFKDLSGPIKPSEEEVHQNSRAKSAILRAATVASP